MTREAVKDTDAGARLNKLLRLVTIMDGDNTASLRSLIHSF